MMRGFPVLVLCVAVMVAGCGGRPQPDDYVTTEPLTPMPKSSGPIGLACLHAGRDNASKRSCGCVQSVANKRLTQNDQNMGAAFLYNPDLAQTARQTAPRQFWTAWMNFAQTAARVCRASV